jgi:FAD dependent oxidoreductase
MKVKNVPTYFSLCTFKSRSTIMNWMLYTVLFSTITSLICTKDTNHFVSSLSTMHRSQVVTTFRRRSSWNIFPYYNPTKAVQNRCVGSTSDIFSTSNIENDRAQQHQFRLAIVGGGLAGLSTAYHYLSKQVRMEQSCHVTIFDSSTVGTGGASSVAGG